MAAGKGVNCPPDLAVLTLKLEKLGLCSGVMSALLRTLRFPRGLSSSTNTSACSAPGLWRVDRLAILKERASVGGADLIFLRLLPVAVLDAVVLGVLC